MPREVKAELLMPALAIIDVQKAQSIYRLAQKGTIFVHLNFSKYWPIFKLVSLSESGENL